MVYAILLGFLLYSMTFTLLNMAWHVFELPNGAHYRYAFIVSFLMIILSVKAVNKLEFITMADDRGCRCESRILKFSE